MTYEEFNRAYPEDKFQRKTYALTNKIKDLLVTLGYNPGLRNLHIDDFRGLTYIGIVCEWFFHDKARLESSNNIRYFQDSRIFNTVHVITKSGGRFECLACVFEDDTANLLVKTDNSITLLQHPIKDVRMVTTSSNVAFAAERGVILNALLNHDISKVPALITETKIQFSPWRNPLAKRMPVKAEELPKKDGGAADDNVKKAAKRPPLPLQYDAYINPNAPHYHVADGVVRAAALRDGDIHNEGGF